MKQKNTKIKLFLATAASLIIAGGVLYTTNQKSMASLDFTKLNNNNFGNKSKYDYMKPNKSFQDQDKKKHIPSALKWNN